MRVSKDRPSATIMPSTWRARWPSARAFATSFRARLRSSTQTGNQMAERRRRTATPAWVLRSGSRKRLHQGSFLQTLNAASARPGEPAPIDAGRSDAHRTIGTAHGSLSFGPDRGCADVQRSLWLRGEVLRSPADGAAGAIGIAPVRFLRALTVSNTNNAKTPTRLDCFNICRSHCCEFELPRV